MNGIINVYKEKGYTSHDVVARLRGITGEKHIGHTGTLDPAATGVLPMCLGSATKACELLTDKGKCYETILLLGIETDTEDSTGSVIKTGDVSLITDSDIMDAVKSFEGVIAQIPPMFSATRINGQRAYDLARQGLSVDREAKNVRVNSITAVSDICRGKLKDKSDFVPFADSMLARFPEEYEMEEGRWQWENDSIYKEEHLELAVIRLALKIDCEKGTYIRTICADIGKKLGCGGCMERLLRTRSGEFTVDNSFRLSQLEPFFADQKLDEEKSDINGYDGKAVVISADKCFMEYPALHIKEK